MARNAGDWDALGKALKTMQADFMAGTANSNVSQQPSPPSYMCKECGKETKTPVTLTLAYGKGQLLVRFTFDSIDCSKKFYAEKIDAELVLQELGASLEPDVTPKTMIPTTFGPYPPQPITVTTNVPQTLAPFWVHTSGSQAMMK